jgi:hypothetical protein
MEEQNSAVMRAFCRVRCSRARYRVDHGMPARPAHAHTRQLKLRAEGPLVVSPWAKLVKKHIAR